MSKLYATITESARRTMPTARAHSSVGAQIKNWGFAVESRMIDRGGGENDLVVVTSRNLDTGDVLTLCNGSILDIQRNTMTSRAH